ncbi:MAG: transpeptidase family protein [Acidobacteriia bacterium]|nr:transpeptidase family protein [Terriglobia bacterium]
MVERRLAGLAALLLVWGAGIVYKLISIQVVQHEAYAREARSHQEAPLEIAAPRGAIFDRTGELLALSAPTHSVFVNPQKIELEYASSILSAELHLDRDELYSRLRAERARGRGYYVVKRAITGGEWQDLLKLKANSSQFDWIQIWAASRREYPNGEVAAHVLGSVDFEEKGDAGIERSLDQDLRGVPGKLRLLTDARGRGIESRLIADPRPGMPLTLTIDERTQYVAERELAAAVAAHNATSGSAVVMNPNTGEVLALASFPSYDPNTRPLNEQDRAARQDHAVSAPFEPGSVFKVITLSAALETTNLRPETMIDCHGGVLKLPGRIIHDSHLGIGTISMADVLARSSNVGAAQIGMRVGPENMYEYVRRFGFGRKTGVELPAESGGMFRKLAGWGKTSLASIAFGHEVGVTTIQLAQAASVIANGGLLVRPRLILKKGGQPVPGQAAVRILRPETAIAMRRMMEGVVVLSYGTGKRAALAGYSVGGKTGSATIFDFATRRYTHTYNGSFMGFAPVTNPAIVVVVTLNGTHGTAGFGGAAAAPVFKAIATEALRILDVPKDLPDEVKPSLLVAKAEPVDAPPDDSATDQPNILADAEEEGAQPEVPGPKAPNFRGMTVRAVLEEAGKQGFGVVPDGMTGIARRQDPPPGAPIRPGGRIKVVFAR